MTELEPMESATDISRY